MNKQSLIEAVMTKINSSKAEATRAVDAIFDTITDTLSKGDEVALSGFGTFRVTKRAARTGRNPRTGEKIQVPATNVPKFKAGKGLKDAVK